MKGLSEKLVGDFYEFKTKPFIRTEHPSGRFVVANGNHFSVNWPDVKVAICIFTKPIKSLMARFKLASIDLNYSEFFVVDKTCTLIPFLKSLFKIIYFTYDFIFSQGISL